MMYNYYLLLYYLYSIKSKDTRSSNNYQICYSLSNDLLRYVHFILVIFRSIQAYICCYLHTIYFNLSYNIQLHI